MDKQGEMFDRLAAGEKIKLNMGAGEQRYKGYVGVDIRPTAACDLQHDLTKPFTMLPDGCCTHIFASHVLEHIPGHKAYLVLKEWHRLLCDKGHLWGYVPDGIAGCELFLKAATEHDEWGERKATDLLLGAYATDHRSPVEQAHYMVYTADSLKNLLHGAGFQTMTVVRQVTGTYDHRLMFCAVKGVLPEYELPEPYLAEEKGEE